MTRLAAHFGSGLSLNGLTLRQLVSRTWRKICDNDVLDRAAAVAFYAMLALVPFLAVVLTVAVQLLPDLTASSEKRGIGNVTVQQFDATLRETFPPEAYTVVKGQVVRLQQEPSVGLVSISAALWLVLCSSLFVGLSTAMNAIHQVAEKRPFWKVRLIGVAMTLLQAVILVGALFVMAAWPFIPGWLGFSPMTRLLATVIQWLVICVALPLSFALTLYVAPDAGQSWRWVSPGSLLGSLVLVAATWLFGVYVQNFSSYDRTYGSLAGVMVLLVWFWVCGVILLSAAQLNVVIDDARRSTPYRTSPIEQCADSALPAGTENLAKSDPRRNPLLKNESRLSNSGFLMTARSMLLGYEIRLCLNS